MQISNCSRGHKASVQTIGKQSYVECAEECWVSPMMPSQTEAIAEWNTVMLGIGKVLEKEVCVVVADPIERIAGALDRIADVLCDSHLDVRVGK